MIVKDSVRDWLIGEPQGLLQIPLPGGTLESLPDPADPSSQGFLYHLAPPGLVKQQRTGSPQGGRGKEEEDKKFLFHPPQWGVPELDPTSHTSSSPHLTPQACLSPSRLLYPKIRITFIYLNPRMIS